MKFPHKPHAKDICECHHLRKEHTLLRDKKEYFSGSCLVRNCLCGKFKLKLAFMDGTT